MPIKAYLYIINLLIYSAHFPFYFSFVAFEFTWNYFRDFFETFGQARSFKNAYPILDIPGLLDMWAPWTGRPAAASHVMGRERTTKPTLQTAGRYFYFI